MRFPRRQSNPGVFFVLALTTVPIAVLLEIGTIDLGHELTWRLFGGMTQVHSAWLRYAIIAVATASAVCAITHRTQD